MPNVRPKLDLRSGSYDDVLQRVERSLDVQLNRTTMILKRRSIGLASDRGTWVRVEVRPPEKTAEQGWNGTETSAALHGVARPEWRQSVSWNDPDQDLMWRADETDLVADHPVKPGGILTADPGLSEKWWATLRSSLTALSGHSTTRLATPHTEKITQARIDLAITGAFGDQLDTKVEQWSAAHADLNWANLTTPTCMLLDWEDWGMAPHGLDPANLWVNSLAVPDLASRVYQECEQELESKTGKIMALFLCADIVSAPPSYSGPLHEPALRAVDRLVKELRL
ncbi:hypothetical protein [Pseudofrankia sp. BMG5.36]|uniref:hypothetical protein n=1 Tax=Pseudofrankia sp. BMG5.36 TaxID=1834512 RepID=UPI0009F4AB63|nr:hypothetical protein [Pseudofrankia sp. BMG5.36]